MELPKKIQETLDSFANIDEELTAMLKAKTDKELLHLAHRIVAKQKVKQDIVFDINKIIYETR